MFNASGRRFTSFSAAAKGLPFNDLEPQLDSHLLALMERKQHA
jgi:hypothetical protein